MRKGEVSMTSGSISSRMIAFAVPIFLGQLFQQLYNTADTLIVGQFCGYEALAAVSSSGNLIQLLVGFFNGLSMGASVVISRQFGAKAYKDMQKTIHSTVVFGLIMSVFLSVFGIWASRILLVWMGTPEEVLPLSNDYFLIYFAGISGLIMYNMFSGILRAVGDSRHPLYFLIASSLTNVCLDLIFVIFFGWGVIGAAVATIISQILSALLALYVLMRVDGPHRLFLFKLSLEWAPMKEVIRYGVPTGVQNSIISLANVVVQTNINAFGAHAMAGLGSYSKLEGFAFLPIMSFNLAISTFVSQNIGAQEYDRAQDGAKFGILCSVGMAEFIGVIFFIFAPTLIAMFDNTPEVVAYGVGRARCNALFYFLLAYSHAVSSVCRGGGKPAVPMYVMLLFWCVIRVTFLTLTAPLHNIQFVNWVYPLTWSMSSIFFVWYYHRKTWLYPTGKMRVVGEPHMAHHHSHHV